VIVRVEGGVSCDKDCVRFKRPDMYICFFTRNCYAILFTRVRHCVTSYAFLSSDQFSIRFLNCHMLSLASVLF